MPSFAVPILWGILAYLIGSFNWALLIARVYGVDILAAGNRNPGASNVYRTVGPLPGIAVYLADTLSGAAVIIPTRWLPFPEICLLVAVFAVFTGTVFPIFSGFKGGTGLAKSTGAVMGINPLGFFIGAPLGLFVIWRLHNPGWAGGLLLGVTLLVSIVVFRDVVGASGIVALALLVKLRALIQYRPAYE